MDFTVISTRDTRREPRHGPLASWARCTTSSWWRMGGRTAIPRGDPQELQQVFMFYGAQTAFNLDGGGSTEMWLCGEIINQPSGGDERSVSDMIWF